MDEKHCLWTWQCSEIGQQGCCLSSSLHFKGMALWDRYSWAAEDTSQREREQIYNCKFSKENTLRKGSWGDYSQVFAETNSKFLWQYWAFSAKRFKETGVSLGIWPQADSSYTEVCLSLSMCVVDKVVYPESPIPLGQVWGLMKKAAQRNLTKIWWRKEYLPAVFFSVVWPLMALCLILWIFKIWSHLIRKPNQLGQPLHPPTPIYTVYSNSIWNIPSCLSFPSWSLGFGFIVLFLLCPLHLFHPSKPQPVKALCLQKLIW